MEEPLIYNIDPTLSLRFRTPVIFISKIQGVPPSLLSLLMDDEREWQKRENRHDRLAKDVHFPYFRLRPLHSYQLLQKLALGQKLVFAGKKMIGDFFSSFKLEYLAEQIADQIGQKYIVHALLHNRAVSEYDLILQGSPHIAIHNLQLSFVDPNISWQDLAPFLDGPKIMSKSEYLSFKKDIDSSSLIEIEAEQQPATLKAEVANSQPSLRLVDNTCSFAKIAPEFLLFEQDLLNAGFIKKDLGNSNFYCPTDKSLLAVENLIKKGWNVVDAQGHQVVAISHSTLTLDNAASHFTIKGSLHFENVEAPLEQVVRHTKQHSRFLPLEGGKTGLLSFENHKELKNLLKEVELVSGILSLAKSNIACLTELASLQDASLVVKYTNDSLGKRLRAAFTSTNLTQILPKSSFNGILRPYQQEGLNWLAALYESGLNGLLADEMGLGKTVQVLAFLSHIQSGILIVVPTSLMYNWKREIEHFLPSMPHAIYHGPERNPKILTENSIIITSYGTLRSDIAVFKQHSFECIILDEAQAIKNSSTLTSKAILELQGRFKLSLTGTPVENSLEELASHFRFLEPDLLENIQNTPLTVLRKKIAPFLLRRKKSEVAKDLPDKVEEIVYVTMNDEQQLLYDRFVAHLKAGLIKKVNQDGAKAHSMEIFEALLRLRQICCHPKLVPQLVESLAPEATTSAKFDLALSDIETLIQEGKKIVLFSQFTSMLHLFAKEAKVRQWPHLLLEGQTKNRQELVDLFQKDQAFPLFLVSLKAGGVGLNLTAADYVLLYDPWWNKAQEAQAVDRAHRIGRKDTVFSKRYYVEGSIEEKILALQVKKGELSDALFEENGAASFTLDDLHEFFT